MCAEHTIESGWWILSTPSHERRLSTALSLRATLCAGDTGTTPMWRDAPWFAEGAR